MRRLLSVFLCFTLLFHLTGCHRERDFSGTWVDSSEGSTFAIYVDGNVFTDNVSGVLRSCNIANGKMTYCSLAGDTIVTDLKFDGNNTVSLFMDTQWYTLTRGEPEPFTSTLLSRGDSPTGSAVSYTRLSMVGPEELGLYPNGVFDFGGLLSGVYSRSVDDSVLALYCNGDIQQIYVDVLYSTGEGSYVYGYPMEIDGTLYADAKYDNKVSEVPSGYTLDGSVSYNGGSVVFDFQPEGLCTKTVDNTYVVEYNYNVNSEGLITLGDSSGLLHEYDYLFFDHECGTVCRLVYKLSSWTAFLNGIISTGETASGADMGEYTVAAPAHDLISGALQCAFVGSNSPAYYDLAWEDSEYTATSVDTIKSELERIASEDIARREYELSRKTERERFLEQVRRQEEAEARARAEMDARAQAAIESSRSGQSSTWYDWE